MLLDGKTLAESLEKKLLAEVATCRRPPHLAVVLVGDNAASRAYVERKQRRARAVGMESSLSHFGETSTSEEVLAEVMRLNGDTGVDGILVQLPLPPALDPHLFARAVVPEKDVDGLHPYNMGRLLRGEEGLVPCTPLGIVTLLEHSGIVLRGRRVVVVGRSTIVGRPLAALLLQRDATVTVAHRATESLEALTREADIVVMAVGVPRFLKASMVREGAVVVDVGMTSIDGRWVGDVDFAAVAPKCRAISPVPGGVGPMTVAMLLHNTLYAHRH